MQQIVISGIGGQGILFVTRILAEAATANGMEVLTSETHGMAMRGGTVVSHVKAGSFRSPLIRNGQADVGLFLHAGSREVHQGLLRQGGVSYINSADGDDATIDATRIASENEAVVIANLVLLGFAVRRGGLFCDLATVEAVLKKISPEKHLAMNLKGFHLGLDAVTGDRRDGR